MSLCKEHYTVVSKSYLAEGTQQHESMNTERNNKIVLAHGRSKSIHRYINTDINTYFSCMHTYQKKNDTQ